MNSSINRVIKHLNKNNNIQHHPGSPAPSIRRLTATPLSWPFSTLNLPKRQQGIAPPSSPCPAEPSALFSAPSYINNILRLPLQRCQRLPASLAETKRIHDSDDTPAVSKQAFSLFTNTTCCILRVTSFQSTDLFPSRSSTNILFCTPHTDPILFSHRDFRRISFGITSVAGHPLYRTTPTPFYYLQLGGRRPPRVSILRINNWKADPPPPPLVTLGLGMG
ncbi:hypothetical protein B0T09DRAFT_333655, partial [Sordaria sp. MPI-SDFR-AT-0083]